jgi:hypothetical protein
MSGGTAIRTKRPCASKYLPFYLPCEKLYHSYCWVKGTTELTPLTGTSYSPGHSKFEIHILNSIFINSIYVCHPRLSRHTSPCGTFGGQNCFFRFLFPVFGLSSVSIIQQTTHSHTYLQPSLYCISSWQSYVRRQSFPSVCLTLQRHWELNKNSCSFSWKAIIASRYHSVATLRQQWETLWYHIINF